MTLSLPRQLGLTAALCGILAWASTRLVDATGEGPAWSDRCTVQPGAARADPAYQRDMDADMRSMMASMQAAEHTGDPDADFLAMMVPHHQGALDMARALLLHGRDPETRQLAEDIIATQLVEIESMRRRLALLRAQPRLNGTPFPALSGTRGR